MTRLFSYVLTKDWGAAPNPFFGICTLVLCKPKIRRAARVGDWVAGLGAADTLIGDVRGRVVYTMRVSQKMTMVEYDAWAQSELPEKLPDLSSTDPRRRVGDALYDFGEDPPYQRRGVHGVEDKQADLGGKYALLSDHFYYFGDDPVPLPEHLRSISDVRRGHRSEKNAPYVGPFLKWVEGLGFEPNRSHGRPQMWAPQFVPLRRGVTRIEW